MTMCGGCTHGFPNIYIFMDDNCVGNPEDCIADIIVHETLHQVLFCFVGNRAFKDLDNIHFMKCRFVSQLLGDNLPEIYAEFVQAGKWDKSLYRGGLG